MGGGPRIFWGGQKGGPVFFSGPKGGPEFFEGQRGGGQIFVAPSFPLLSIQKIFVPSPQRVMNLPLWK